MKTLKRVFFTLVTLEDGEYMPENPEPRKFYYSPQIKGSSHLCACGCGQLIWLPIMVGEWSLTINKDNTFNITPSILQLNGCKAHYVITNSIANII